eukprot:365228-Chlamydomonas_euryale.AAC.30
MGRTEPHGTHGGEWGRIELRGYMGLNGAAWAAWAAWSYMSWMGLHGAASSCMSWMGLHGAACRCNSCNSKTISEAFKVSVNVNHCCGGCRRGSCRCFLLQLQHRLLLLIGQLFPLLLCLLVLLVLAPSPRDGVLMTLGKLLCTGAHQGYARKDRHESVRTPWHTLVAETPDIDPLCEIHTVRSKCCNADPATPPAPTGTTGTPPPMKH